MVFPANSRYQAIETTRLSLPDGTELVYLQRRFVPAPPQQPPWQEHVVVQGDRLDNIAGRVLRDAEQFWRLCDANRAMRPEALVETIGRRLAMPLPDGLPGTVRV